MDTHEFDMYPHDKSAVIAIMIFFGFLQGMAVVMAFWLDSLALKCVVIPLALLFAVLCACVFKRAETKLVLTDHAVSIVNGRKVILPATDLHSFPVVYLLDLTWRYTGKYRVGDPIGKEVWNSLRYCVFSGEEISEDALLEISNQLRKKRPSGAIFCGLAFCRDEKYYHLIKNHISENSAVYERKITMKPGPY
ncbi:MAG: hypothetical protein IKJ99_06565 [Oscillospiraceae bacterium]|nr:hypothetical protein [Oscillospiraceae bacterium]